MSATGLCGSNISMISILGCETTCDNLELVEFSDVVILAVKPLIIPKVIQNIQSKMDVSKLLMSIAAGVKIDTIAKDLNKDAKVWFSHDSNPN